jgi:protoporphyrinogen oxidase
MPDKKGSPPEMKTLCQGPILIAGGGPTGLGAAYLLDRLGFDNWLLLERSNTFGGLSRSYLDEQGYTWDIGGHIAFSHYDLFTELLDGLLDEDGWIEHERESWIRILGVWAPYPFQNNLHRLPKAERERCVSGLRRAASEFSERPFSDFADFIDRTFGAGIAELFMTPYNRKVWAVEPAEMDAGWIADRVAIPDVDRVEKNIRDKKDDVSWGPNNTFRFPKHGGTGAIWRALAGKLPSDRLKTGAEIVGIDLEKKRVTLSSGETLEYQALINTTPLDRFCAASGVSSMIDAAEDLRYSSTHVIGIGLDQPVPSELESKCWMYFPEEKSPFYRVTHFSHYSPNNADDIQKHWSLMCEVSEVPESRQSRDEVLAKTLDGLVASGLIREKSQVVHTWMTHAEHSYPIPTLRRNEAVSYLLAALTEKGVYSRGRFGAWNYEVGNMDHCFMQGYEAAANLLNGAPEMTLPFPNLVNSPKRKPEFR